MSWCYNISFLNLACLKALCQAESFLPVKERAREENLISSLSTNPAAVPFSPHLSISLIPGTRNGQATTWHLRKNKTSLRWWKSPLRKSKGTENKLKARQTNQKADFPFSTFLEEVGREVPYGQKPALPLDLQLKSEAQGKDSSSPPVRRDCKHNKVSCRKTVQDSNLRLAH